MKIVVFNFWVACILVSVNACDVETQYEKGGVCCNMCGPGTRMSNDASCEDPNCISCGEHEYQPSYTLEKKCQLQPFCDPNMNLEQGPLDSRKRVSCACKSGHHCSSEECLTCVPNTDCKPGQGVLKMAKGSTDTICQACDQGTFSNRSSAVERCHTWTMCDEKTQTIKKTGTPKSDVECEEIPRNVALAVGLSVGIILLIAVSVAFIYWFKKDPKNFFKKCNPGDEDDRGHQDPEGFPKKVEPQLQLELENGVGPGQERGPVECEEPQQPPQGRGMTENNMPLRPVEDEMVETSPESGALLPDSIELSISTKGCPGYYLPNIV